MSFCKVERSLGLRISCLSALGIHSSAAKKAAGCPWRLTFCFLQTPRKSRICRSRPWKTRISQPCFCVVGFLSFCYAAPDVGEPQGCPSSAVPVMSPKYTRHTLKMPFGKIRPISCYFLSYSKVGEKCSFVTPKGKNCPGFSCMEVRVFINRFGDGTMENSWTLKLLASWKKKLLRACLNFI